MMEALTGHGNKSLRFAEASRGSGPFATSRAPGRALRFGQASGQAEVESSRRLMGTCKTNPLTSRALWTNLKESI
jgi:hypothetical protein